MAEESVEDIQKNVEELSLRDSLISFGDVFLLRKHSKPLLLRRGGQLLDENFINKIENKNIAVESFIQDLNKYNELLDILVNSNDEHQRIAATEKFLITFYKAHWVDEEDFSMLDFILPIFNTFNQFSAEELDQIVSINPDLFRRGLVVGSLSIVFAFINRYTSVALLKDLFQLSIVSQYYLAETVMNTNYIESLEAIRNVAKVKRDDVLKDLDAKYEQLNNLRIRSVDKANETYTQHFQLKNSINLLKIIDEDGFDLKSNLLTNGDFSDWERCLIFANKIVPYSNLEFDKSDKKYIAQIFKEIKEKKTHYQLNLDLFIRNINMTLHSMRKRLGEIEEQDIEESEDLLKDMNLDQAVGI